MCKKGDIVSLFAHLLIYNGLAVFFTVFVERFLHTIKGLFDVYRNGQIVFALHLQGFTMRGAQVVYILTLFDELIGPALELISRTFAFLKNLGQSRVEGESSHKREVKPCKRVVNMECARFLVDDQHG